MAKKIVIMDDEPTIADLYTEALAEEGYETFRVTQSLRFFDALKEHQPNLVLLDLMMPFLDGRDELKLMELAGREGQIPVIVVTAYPNVAREEQDLRSAGVVQIVQKPADLDKLIELVEQTIGSP
ncbi:sporulation initiation phosphotransferase F [Reticulibacter mediterranei]|uniref:Sporulation initiation phosphotransferase F n=1 Tax=Reticulibacter mediterranei TaxID=2778369 RepID=A0A8J3IHT4_9CHLR|nr:response regulator [Reticulibacter mediterranei]GHO91707.1 sporulation initiation phosphotransferase F [Reticulibacter mediterranei]